MRTTIVSDVFGSVVPGRVVLGRAVLASVVLAVISTAAYPAEYPAEYPQDPSKPTSELPRGQQKPSDPPLSVLCAPGITIQLGVAYTSSVIASGGSGAYQFAVTGGALPAGIGLDPATGAMSGTPTADGTFTYTVQVTDSAGAMATTGSTPCTLQLPVAAPAAATPAAAPAANPTVEAAPATKPPVIAQPEIDPAKIDPAKIDPAKLGLPRDKAIQNAAQGVPQDDHPFILGAEDQITVLIYSSPEFGGSHMIRPDGKITMPFLGDVMAAGFAPLELGSIIREKLKKYIVDPDVSVQVNAVNSKKFYIQGEVGKTGGFPLLVPTRVLEALVNAGGFKDFANQKKIVIMRLTGERLKFNYKEVIQGKKMDQNIYLKPGDIIIVK